MGMTMTQTQATTLAETGLLCPETLSEARTRLISELVQGKELTTQLQILLNEPSGYNGSFSARQMVGKILRSFTETISVLSCDNSNNKNKTESSVLCEESLPSSDDIGSENSIQSKKRLRSKIGRGCYKRRTSCQSWMTVCPTLDDGHAWRKYGQKDILNATYPRCYFRCTHKFDQGCKATKQVQKMEDNAQMYQTTYIGVHTCKEINNSPQMIRDPESWEPYIINTSEAKPLIFGNKQQEVMSFTSSTTVKMEQKEEETKAGDNFTVKKEQKQETTIYNLGDPKGTLNDEHDDDSIWKNDLTGFGSPESIFMPSKAGNFLENDTNFNMDSNNNSYYYFYPCEADDSSNSYLADLDLRFESIGDGDIQFGGCELS